MKHLLVLSIACTIFITMLTSSSLAYTKGSWNYNYSLGTVRQNGTGFWFNVSNETKFFGCYNTLPNYNTLVLIIMTAKASGKTINFYVDADALPNSGGSVVSITAVDIN